MTLAEFSNALRILHSIDWPDAKGIVSGEAYDYDYRRDPVLLPARRRRHASEAVGHHRGTTAEKGCGMSPIQRLAPFVFWLALASLAIPLGLYLETLLPQFQCTPIF